MALGYQVAILSVWWKRGELDVRFFSSKLDQKNYFDNLILGWSTLNNFNINDNITTQITFRDKTNRSIETLLKCNYAIVKNPNGDYRYYFITDIRADSSNQVIVTLDLDDINTNLVGHNLGIFFVDSWTGYNYKRYIDNNNDIKYKLFTNPNEKSLVSNNDNPPLFHNSTNTGFVHFTGVSDIDIWLNENIFCWRYIFFSDNSQFYFWRYNSSGRLEKGKPKSVCSSYLGSLNYITLPYNCFNVPIYKTTKRIYIKASNTIDNTTAYFKLDIEGLNYFFQDGERYDYHNNQVTNYPIGTNAIEEKFSLLPPFLVDFINSNDYEIDVNGDLIINATNDYENISDDKYLEFGLFPQTPLFTYLKVFDGAGQFATGTNTTKSSASNGFLGGFIQSNTTMDVDFDNPIKLNDISNPIIYNSKLLDYNYMKLKLRVANFSYDYNPLALLTYEQDVLHAKYTEILKVGITKVYLRFNNNGAYLDNETDYTGVVGSLDLTEPLLNNQWADYLASHKNYYLQYSANLFMNAGKGFINSFASGNDSKMVNGLSNTLIGSQQNYLNEKWNRENMQQTPNELSNANCEAYFTLNINDLYPKLDLISLPTLIHSQVANKLILSGQPIKKLMNYNEVIFKHRAYDFIKGEIETNNLLISNKEFIRLKNCINQGKRFWYEDGSSPLIINDYL